MFTGIVQQTLSVHNIMEETKLNRVQYIFPNELLDGLKVGASVANNGTCLTVASIEDDLVSFDVMMESLTVTNLGALKIGDEVNIERSLTFGDEVGGHVLSGHVHTQAKISNIEMPQNNYVISFELVDKSWSKYLFNKGFAAINGCSLTVNEVVDGRFAVYLIPETLRITNFSELKVGDMVNLEVDSTTQTIVDTLERMKADNRL